MQLWSLVLAPAMLAGMAVAAAASQSSSSLTTFLDVTLSNNRRFFWDVNGKAIGNGEGRIQWIGNRYIWFGNDRTEQRTWTSIDLIDWYPNDILFNVSSPVNSTACSGFGTCHRANINYN
ncbi:hypothetical protein BDW74DRAFT_181776 [Aspergillus multicolor]|uniref:uncharacterized protein n=1 Tax=Aspergillus multicolor TaxID=41759 RepID=UPI003CCCBDC7